MSGFCAASRQTRTPKSVLGTDWIVGIDSLFRGKERRAYRSSIRRLRPNRRASIDQAPGPSIASAIPTEARRIRAQGSSVREKAVQTASPASTPPAIGVHRPAQRSKATARSITAVDKDRCKASALSAKVECCDCRAQPEEQESHPRPPTGKSRIQALHRNSLFKYKHSVGESKP